MSQRRVPAQLYVRTAAVVGLGNAELEAEAREQLLCHHFLNGLPEKSGMAIRTSRYWVTSDAALGRALVLTAAMKARAVAPQRSRSVSDNAQSRTRLVALGETIRKGLAGSLI